MATATFKDYIKLLEDRPRKFDTSAVGYRESASKEKCGCCIHLFRRVLDAHAVCEIFRNREVDEDGIRPEYVCDFYTRNGETFPLLQEKKRD